MHDQHTNNAAITVHWQLFFDTKIMFILATRRDDAAKGQAPSDTRWRWLAFTASQVSRLLNRFNFQTLEEALVTVASTSCVYPFGRSLNRKSLKMSKLNENERVRSRPSCQRRWFAISSGGAASWPREPIVTWHSGLSWIFMTVAARMASECLGNA